MHSNGTKKCTYRSRGEMFSTEKNIINLGKRGTINETRRTKELYWQNCRYGVLEITAYCAQITANNTSIIAALDMWRD